MRNTTITMTSIFLLVGMLFISTPLSGAVMYDTALTTTTTYSGRSIGISINSVLNDISFGDTGELPASGGIITANVPLVNNILVKGDSLVSLTNGFENGASSMSASSDLLLLHGTPNEISVDFVEAEAIVSATGSITGRSEVANLVVGGEQVIVTGMPNQIVDIPGIFSLVINEQIPTMKDGVKGITVNALHLKLISGDEVIVSSVKSEVITSTIPVTNASYQSSTYFIDDDDDDDDDDRDRKHKTDRNFAYGSGKIKTAPRSDAKFGFSVGFFESENDLDGKIKYKDKKGDLELESETITSFSGTGNTRTFSGIAEIDDKPGVYEFTVTVTDNGKGRNTDTFKIEVSNGYTASGVLEKGNIHVFGKQHENNPPVATNDMASTDKNIAVTIPVLANDSDPNGDTLSVSSVSTASNGNVNLNSDNTVTYTPNQNFVGDDSFTYSVSDGKGGSDTAMVSLTVNNTILLVEKINSGLLAFDPLNNETKSKEELEADKRYWTWEGSANNFVPPAPLDFFQNETGRYIGVESPADGTYAGWYAVSPSTDGMLFHGVAGVPMRFIEDQFFQNGLYVQTDNGLINYVTCVSITSQWGTTWHLIRTEGNNESATFFEVLWSDPATNQPLERDCTIVTNGDNFLRLYLDGVKVFDRNDLDLKMPAPFWYFLEPQNSHKQMHYGYYKDYYATKSEMLNITNLPNDANKVQIVDQNNNVLMESTVTAGTASMEIGMMHFPVVANIKVLDSSNSEIASTSNLQNIYGGDTFSISPQ